MQRVAAAKHEAPGPSPLSDGATPAQTVRSISPLSRRSSEPTGQQTTRLAACGSIAAASAEVDDVPRNSEWERAHLLYVERRGAVLRGDRRARRLSASSIVTASEARHQVLWSLVRTAGLAVAYVTIAVLLMAPTEGWDWADCAYFAIVTLTTVGYGDLSPASDVGKLLSMMLAVGGLIIVTSSLNHLIETFVNERRRASVAATVQRLDDTTHRIAARADSGNTNRQFGSSPAAGVIPHDGEPLSSERGGIDATAIHQLVDAVSECARGLSTSLHAVLLSRLQTRQVATLLAFGRSSLWVLQTASPFLFAIFAFSCLGHFQEGFAPLDSVYYAIISLLTVGYGDFSPVTRLGRAFCTLFLPIACASSLRSISRLGAALDYGGRAKHLEQGMGEGEKNGEDGAISRMSRLLKAQVGDEGLITEADYVCATLLELELIDEDVLTKVREQFYRLDTRAAGVLSLEGYLKMVSVKTGGAKARWLHAASVAMQEQRVLKSLTRARAVSSGMPPGAQAPTAML